MRKLPLSVFCSSLNLSSILKFRRLSIQRSFLCTSLSCIALCQFSAASAEVDAKFVQIESQYVGYAVAQEYLTQIPVFQLLQGPPSREPYGNGMARLSALSNSEDDSHMPAYIGLFKLDEGLPTLVIRKEMIEPSRITFDAITPGDYWILGIPMRDADSLPLPSNLADVALESFDFLETTLFLHENWPEPLQVKEGNDIDIVLRTEERPASSEWTIPIDYGLRYYIATSETPAVAVTSINEFPALGSHDPTRIGYVWTSRLDASRSIPLESETSADWHTYATTRVLFADAFFVFSFNERFKDFELANNSVQAGIPFCDFKKPLGQLRGFVLDQNNAPVTVGMLVMIHKKLPYSVNYPIGNKRGEFRVDGIPKGDYDVRFSPQDAETYYDPYVQRLYSSEVPVAMRIASVSSGTETAQPLTVRISRYARFFAREVWSQDAKHLRTVWILHHNIDNIEKIKQSTRSGENDAHLYFQGRHPYTFFDQEVDQAAHLKLRVEQVDDIIKNGGGLISIHRADDLGVLLGHTFLSDLSQDESRPTLLELRE